MRVTAIRLVKGTRRSRSCRTLLSFRGETHLWPHTQSIIFELINDICLLKLHTDDNVTSVERSWGTNERTAPSTTTNVSHEERHALTPLMPRTSSFLLPHSLATDHPHDPRPPERKASMKWVLPNSTLQSIDIREKTETHAPGIDTWTYWRQLLFFFRNNSWSPVSWLLMGHCQQWAWIIPT